MSVTKDYVLTLGVRPSDARALGEQLGALDLRACADPDELTALIRETPPRMIVLGDSEEALALCDRLKLAPDTAGLPIVISSERGSPELLAHCFPAWATTGTSTGPASASLSCTATAPPFSG